MGVSLFNLEFSWKLETPKCPVLLDYGESLWIFSIQQYFMKTIITEAWRDGSVQKGLCWASMRTNVQLASTFGKAGQAYQATYNPSAWETGQSGWYSSRICKPGDSCCPSEWGVSKEDTNINLWPLHAHTHGTHILIHVQCICIHASQVKKHSCNCFSLHNHLVSGVSASLVVIFIFKTIKLRRINQNLEKVLDIFSLPVILSYKIAEFQGWSDGITLKSI